jgi:transcriptional regulator
MYTPTSFKVDDIDTAHAFMREFSFATVCSQTPEGVSATHLPFTIDSTRGLQGTMLCHLARANPLWKSWSGQQEVLVVFTGPHAYISPAWYQKKESVPTWNYSAVHAYGRPRMVESNEALITMVRDLVVLYEGHEGSTWDQRLMEPMLDQLVGAIVGFEIPIERIETKFKFNQNRSLEDQLGVIEALEGSELHSKREAGQFMRKVTGL